MGQTQPKFHRNRLSQIVSRVLTTGAAAGIAASVAMSATLTVTTTDDNTMDDSACTLREAIETINGNPPNSNCGPADGTGDTVDLTDLSGTIILGGSDIDIGNSTYIDGPGEAVLTISGNNTSLIFYIYHASEVIIEGVTLSGGSASFGAGIYNDDGNTTLINATVSGNSALEIGGGIYNNYGNTTLINATVSGNSAGIYGGGIYNGAGTMILVNSTVSGNSSDLAGGGIYNDYGDTALINSTVSGNSAYYGGGIYNNNGTATLINTTVSGNSADTKGEGGGILNINNGDTTLINSLLGNNTLGDCFTSAGTVNLDSYSLIEVDASGSNACDPGNVTIREGPMLGPLDDNGGPTETHALLPGSAAINAGANCSGEPVNGLDQRGYRRIGNCDIGAFEFGHILSDSFE